MGVIVGVRVGLRVGVGVAVSVGVFAGVGAWVGVAVGVRVTVGVGVGVAQAETAVSINRATKRIVSVVFTFKAGWLITVTSLAREIEYTSLYTRDGDIWFKQFQEATCHLALQQV